MANLIFISTLVMRLILLATIAYIVGLTQPILTAFGVFQILLLDLVFSVDSIITAVCMTDHLAIMYIAVIVAITLILVAANPLTDFIERNPTIVMLALGFLLMIGT